MTDLFSQPARHDPTPDCDLAYRADLQRQITQDTIAVRARGQLANWTGEDEVLQQDEYRLVQAAYEQPVRWSMVNVTIQQEATRIMGLNNPANALAVVARCIRLGYIQSMFSAVASCEILQATQLGADKLDEYDDLKAWNIL